jgi:aspartate/methionine/tyrosine aminotransferase
MDKDFLQKIIDLLVPHDTWLLCDEVYRGLDGSGNGFTASVADLYDRSISTGSMSKVYSLAGLRLGWLASRAEGILDEVMTHRDYNTISVGMLDDYFASMALESRSRVLERSHKITRGNRQILADWVAKEPSITWVPPRSGTTALLKYDLPVSSWDFCVRLVEETGVMLCPGSVLNQEGWLRIGYANNQEILTRGLVLLTGFLAKLRAELSATKTDSKS